MKEEKIGDLNCPRCFSVSITKNGNGHTNQQHYKCKECGHNFIEDIPNGAKVLIFDIENAPVEVYAWNKRLWNTSIPPSQLIKDWYMLTWCAKWLNDSDIMKYSVTPKESINRDDSRIVKKLWQLFDEADLVVAHNAIKFDVPMVNTRFITLGLKPPSPYRIVDTLKVGKKIGSFTYNHLDFYGKVFEIGRKKDTDFQLWIDCVAGDKTALQTMLDYNEQDVLLLEEVYLRFRSWMKGHPNMNMFQKENGCANCGSLKISPKGYYFTSTNKYRSWVCNDCGAFSRETKKSKVSVSN